MLKMWQLWLAFLVLGIADGESGGEGDGEEGDKEPPEGEEPPPEGDELPGDDLDSLIETVEDDGGETKSKPRANDAIRTARERAQAADEARIRAEATLDAERRMRTSQQGPSEDQRLYEQEEARLRDPEVAEIEKWQIRSNRTLRANTQAANTAMLTAADMQDKAAFDRLEFTKPKVYKAYADKVEKALTEMRGRGEKAPRLALLSFLIGKDVIDGKVQSTGSKKATRQAENSGVDRGKPPGARSDVAGKGKMTNLQKLEAKLKGVRI